MNHTKSYIQEFGSGSLLPVQEDRSRISIARRVGFVILLSLLVAATGCKEDRLPTDPGGRIVPIPTPGPPTAQGGPGIVGIVLPRQPLPNGACLVGATVELLDGPLAGQQQIQNDCGGHYMLGFRFVGIPVDTPVTVRASMPGYISKVESITSVAETATPSGFYQDWDPAYIILEKE